MLIRVDEQKQILTGAEGTGPRAAYRDARNGTSTGAHDVSDLRVGTDPGPGRCSLPPGCSMLRLLPDLQAYVTLKCSAFYFNAIYTFKKNV